MSYDLNIPNVNQEKHFILFIYLLKQLRNYYSLRGTLMIKLALNFPTRIEKK